MLRWLVLATALMGCHPFVAAGYDMSTRVGGPLSSVVAAPATPAARSTTTTPAAPLPPTSGATYAFAFGGGSKNFAIEAGLQAQNVSSASFSLPSVNGVEQGTIVDPGTPHYITVTSNLLMRVTLLRTRFFSTNLYVGPGGALVFDRTTANRAWGEDLRYGVGVSANLKWFAAFADVSRTVVMFADGPATGTSTIDGIMVGLALHN